MKYSTTITTTWHLAAVAACCFVPTAAFTSVSKPTTTFLGSSVHTSQHSSSSSSRAFTRMDMEEPNSKVNQALLQRYNVPLPSHHKTRLQIPRETHQQQQQQQQQPSFTAEQPALSVDEALQQHGLPWKSSIDPSHHPADPEQGLFYMPFFEFQIKFIKENLTNLRVIPTESQAGDDLSYIESTTAAAGAQNKQQPQPVRMVTLCFASDEYRKIRMTVYDAGNRTQVFTSLWYPAADKNLPVLGVDLLQFNQDRHLCVVDFQPIMASEAQHANRYEHLLKPIRDQYESLQGKMTKRFYDEDHHFSNQMLYSRFEELHDQSSESSSSSDQTQADHPAYRDLFPAYQQYVQAHLDLIQSTPPAPADIPKVKQGQAAYDTYSADRDPAHAMFTKVFGPKFADAFVYDVLFSFSKGTERATA